MNALLLSLIGTPVIFYGDEIAKLNDRAFYDDRVAKTGYQDSRYLNRGAMDWAQIERDLRQETSLAARVFYPLRQLLHKRRSHPAFSRGSLHFFDLADRRVLAYERSLAGQTVTVLANLSDQLLNLNPGALLSEIPEKDLLEQTVRHNAKMLELKPFGFHWFAT
jgi:maltose alpha-D-glucosyltransferase/alpha-amylase